MDSFYACLALCPLAAYLVALGVVNFGRRPVVVSGGRDILAMGLALSGLALGGPMQLFFPEHAATKFGPIVWALLLVFYSMAVTLWALVARPRLVVYNVSAAELRPVLAELAQELDPQSSWAEDSVAVPQLDVRLHLEEVPSMRNVSLVSSGERQNPAGWRKLEQHLRGRLRGLEVARNLRGLSFVSCGLLMLALLFYKARENPEAIAQGLRDMLRI